MVLNKSDRATSRPAQVEADLFDLFATLGASDEQMDYPVIYASAKQGWAVTNLAAMPTQEAAESSLAAQSTEGMRPLFDMVLEHCPAPKLSRTDDTFSMITIQIENGASMSYSPRFLLTNGKIRTLERFTSVVCTPVWSVQAMR